MTLAEFHQVLRETGRYETPVAHPVRRRPVRGMLVSWRFYFGCLGGCIGRGARLASRLGRLDATVWAQLGFRLMRDAEAMGATCVCDGFLHLAQAKGPVVFVANHMSLVETIALPPVLMAFGPLTIVAKRSLSRYPFFGASLKAVRPILVSRKNVRQDLHDVLEQGVQSLNGGRSVLLFPQSTRSRSFDPRSFHSLGIKLAQRAGVALVPIALQTDLAPPGRWLRDFGPVDLSRPIRFSCGPVLPSDMSSRARHAAAVQFIATRLRAWDVPVISADQPSTASTHEVPDVT